MAVIRVLLLIPTLDAAGAEKQFTLLASGLPRDQFEPHVAVLSRSGPYEASLQRAGIPVTILGKRFKADPVAFWKLRRLIARLQPDILHTWLFAANAYGRFAVRGNSPRVVVSERCVDSWKSPWQLRTDRRLIPRTAALVANSNSVAEFYQEQGVPAELVHVIPNGIAIPPPPPFDERESIRRSVRDEFNLPPNSRIVLSAGRLASQKRFDTLVWAMQLLRQLTQNVFHLVVGDGPERAELEHLASHFTCDHVTRFAGRRGDMDRLLAAGDLYWMASAFEGQSNSLMEAMAAGLPVIASDIPPNRELIEDGTSGLLVKTGDSAAFAQYADRLLADQQWSQRLGNAAQEHMANEHAIETMVERYATLYQSINHSEH